MCLGFIDNRQQLPFVRYIQRIEAEHFTRRLHRGAYRDRSLFQHDPNLRGARDLVKTGCHAPAGWIAQHMHAVAGRDDLLHQVIERSNVALYLSLESEVAARAQDRDSMLPNGPRENHLVSRPGTISTDFDSWNYRSNASGRDVKTVRLTHLHNFGVPGDDVNTCLLRRVAHRFDHLLNERDLYPFLQDEASCQIKRVSAKHGHVVDRAAHCQATDVSPGEEQRPHHMRVGADRNSIDSVQLHAAGVVPGAQYLIVERGKELLPDQTVHQAPAAPMTEHDLLVRLNRNRAHRAFEGHGLVGRGHVGTPTFP